MSKEERQELIRLFIRFLKRSKLISRCSYGTESFFKFFDKHMFIRAECLLKGYDECISCGDGIKLTITDNLKCENRTLSIQYSTLYFEPNDFEVICEDVEIYDIKQFYLVIMYAYFLSYIWKRDKRLPIKLLEKKIIIEKIIKRNENEDIY
jgi:hypothetical protein